MANDLTLKTYDPKKITITFGPILVVGFMSGTFFNATTGEAFELVVGADGTTNRVNKNVTSKEVTITIMQTSITNDLFTVQHLLDKETNAGVLPLTVKDNNGTSLFFSPYAYIMGEPDITYSDGIEGREWKLTCSQTVTYIGGNV